MTLSAFQQAVLHLAIGVVGIASAVVLAVMNKITGTEALAIIIAAGGFTGTGLAGANTSVPVSTPVAVPPALVAQQAPPVVQPLVAPPA